MEKKLIKQLALPLSFRNVKNHSNFILNKVNEVALSLIDEFNDIQKFKKKFNFPVLILYGPTGSGKTHLAHIYKEITDSKFVRKFSNIDLNEAKLGKSFIFDDSRGVCYSPPAVTPCFFGSAHLGTSPVSGGGRGGSTRQKETTQ